MTPRISHALQNEQTSCFGINRYITNIKHRFKVYSVTPPELCHPFRNTCKHLSLQASNKNDYAILSSVISLVTLKYHAKEGQ